MSHSLLSFVAGMLQFRSCFICSVLIICLVRCTPSFAQNVTEEWARLYNGEGPGDEYFQAVATDDEGNLYLTSTSFISTVYRYGASRSHGEILTVKYAPSGEALWSSRFIADNTRDIYTYNEEARAIAVDGSGGVYVAGLRRTTESGTLSENQNIILFKLNAADGSLTWETEFAEGDDDEEVSAIAVDEAGGVYLAGTSTSASYLQDYLTLKYSSTDGALLWDRQYDGVAEGNDKASAIAVDNKGGVVVTGKSYRELITRAGRGPTFPVYDITTIKYDAENGEDLWISSYTGDTLINNGGSLRYQPLHAALALDDTGDVYVTGKFRSLEASDGTTLGVVTVKYDNGNGNQLWEARYNSGTETDPSIALDASGGVYVAGRFGGSGLFNQLYTVKYNAADGEQLWEAIYTGATDGALAAPLIRAGNADDVFLTSVRSEGALRTGLVTIRYNSLSGTPIWDAFYRASLSGTGYPMSNLAEPHAALALDKSGNSYVIGSAYTTDSENSNLFILKYAVADGAPVWEERYEATGSTHDFVLASAVDAEGNTYVTGISQSAGAGNKIIIIKYSASGEELWVRSYDGSTSDRPYAIALDGAGGVYVAGITAKQGSLDYLTLKLNASDGSVVWEVLYDGGANSGDGAYAIALDDVGGVYVTGGSRGPGAPENSDITTIKYKASNGEQVWVNRYDNGLNMHGRAAAIAVDNTGSVYVSGSQVYSNDDYSGRDFLTLKLSAETGEQLWAARYDGGEGYDAAIALVLDKGDGVYVTGRSTGENGREAFATIKYDAADGSQLWLSAFSSEGRTDVVNDIAVDKGGGVYVTGYSYVISPEQQIQADYVTVKYEAVGGEQVWVETYGEENSDSRGFAIAVDSIGGVYVTGQHITGAVGDKRGAAATLKYNAADGALQWEVLKEGIGEEARTIGLDQSGNVYVAGSSFSSRTYGDFLTIKYSQTDGCTPVVAQAISGATTVRAGTQNVRYTLSGTGASSFDWSVQGDQPISVTGQGTEEITVNWPSEAGIYEVGVSYSTGTACPASDTTLTVAVFDPNAGFVIGAGWFNSPVNPSLPYMQSAGKAYFAFASWYAKDARTVPGYMAFHFNAGGLNFSSAAHTPMRLVISGNQANYTGRGMVNGKDDYGFLVAAVDEDLGQGRQQDRLRLKIWELATGQVVYDNQAGAGEGAVASTAIDVGQIVIHRPLGRSLAALAEAAETASQGAVTGKPQLQAYPTMFSGKTNVSFTLDQEQEYTIGLYDMNGSLMRNLGSGRAQAGRQYKHLIHDNGLAEGLYFVRLIAGAEVQTVKIVLRR